MFSVGFFEIALCVLVALIVLKPEQLVETARTIRYMIFKMRELTTHMEQDFINQENQKALEERIRKAAKVSDVSDLLPEPDNEHE